MATLKLAADGVIRIDHDYMLSPEHEESYGHFLAAFARTVQLRLGETVETVNGHRFQLTGFYFDGPERFVLYTFRLVDSR